MFGDKTEQQVREEILGLAAEYCRKFHKKEEYVLGKRVPYASRVYDEKEIVNLIDSALEFWLTSGRYTSLFEKKCENILESGIVH